MDFSRFLTPENLAGLSYVLSSAGAGMAPKDSWQQGLGNSMSGMMQNLQYSKMLAAQPGMEQPQQQQAGGMGTPSEVKIKFAPDGQAAPTTQASPKAAATPAAQQTVPTATAPTGRNLGAMMANGGAGAMMPPFPAAPLRR